MQKKLRWLPLTLLAFSLFCTNCSCEEEDLFVVCADTCYTGPAGTEGVGRCQAGRNPVCDEEGNILECDDVLPLNNEQCNNVDDDCDGEVDENLAISPHNPDNQCSNCGICRGTWERCGAGEWYCDWQNGPPRQEVCDGTQQDEDCDCQVDEEEDLYPEGEIVFCYTGPEETATVGECRPGIEFCNPFTGEVDCDDVTPKDEICDEKDNDCDGFVDNTDLFYEVVTMVLGIDVSSSMGQVVQAVTNVICDYAMQTTSSGFKFAVVLIASPDGDFSLYQNVSDPITTCQALLSFPIQGGDEPTLSALEAVTDPNNPLMIAWPEGTKRLFVGFADEHAQVVNGANIDDTITNTLAYCDASETDVYWFIDEASDYFETAVGCDGGIFQLTEYEPWMLEDMNSIIQGICLAEDVTQP